MNHNTQELQPDANIYVGLQNSSLSDQKINSSQSAPPLGAIGLGLLAGIVGVASMSMAERPIHWIGKDEKSNAVPTEKIEKLLRKPEKMGSGGWFVNHAIHWGQGAFRKIWKPAYSNSRLQSSIPSFVFTGVRLSTDQILENLLRTGPQKSLSKYEKRIDLFQKAAYAFATGFFADLLIKSRNQRLPSLGSKN